MKEEENFIEKESPDIDILAAIDRAWERAGRQIADNFDSWIIEETDKEYRKRKKNRRRRSSKSFRKAIKSN